ncbi:MAG: 16S rRNA (cytosine(1402)-N(4))-methyltransferase RsmH [Patescibacteria group bacterium]|nr:16S rRNA (cytosine(1402)-N(4))-methyltransferase RsmH [Patescibacteria group bacterium]MDD3778087.1 16S rRNA (cytosine(1402)-N(4))-methyltransferase RsmH [Patescibacteria group bacterium]MDD3939066.1 16S rRNA (cytosine(1402)-N(4))-methyltransferase RsmH [Patescibacteria group bacterium]MDD4443631.1 16S rRNA (cytosine(1402)-N(4))-methyltransferase RsmH [Patescibacteria group bacterium]
MKYHHIPVMLSEVVKHLAVKPGGIYIDCTLGGAGYTLELAKRVGPKGRVLALDMDIAAISNAKEKIAKQAIENVILVQENFKNIAPVFHEYFKKEELVDGIVFDLGLSSFQLSDKKRSFSFQNDVPLDMAFGKKAEKQTVEIINNYKLLDLTEIFREYGEEKNAYKIAKAIVLERKKRKIETTQDLVDIIVKQYPKRAYYKIHPATKVFQALRIETNQEFNNLKTALADISKILKFKGRIVVVSFHSGEDRIVKQFFKNNEEIMPIVKKPVVASENEVASNPRARSAKLRSGIKVV